MKRVVLPFTISFVVIFFIGFYLAFYSWGLGCGDHCTLGNKIVAVVLILLVSLIAASFTVFMMDFFRKIKRR